ncbi:hypothetical protein FOZ60_013882 [Perkinsus olseni]|uniref:Tyr recombinase domain-containing protein n=1 Tax=Perkinsus olseni TaxID=32597 RepID=A0A7J6N9P5_PEROL|nr:hypothetical protein FOZ60_013882 [Perkinsus olseni]
MARNHNHHHSRSTVAKAVRNAKRRMRRETTLTNREILSDLVPHTGSEEDYRKHQLQYYATLARNTQAAAKELRVGWSHLLGCSSAQALCSPLCADLLRSLYVATTRPNEREDLPICDEISKGLADEELVRLTLQSAKRILRNRKQKRTVTLTLEQVKQVMLLNPPSGRTVSVVAFLTGIFCLLRLKEDAVTASPTVNHVRMVYALCIGSQKYWTKGPNEASKPTLFGLSYSQLSKDINALVENVFKDTDPEIEVGRKTSHSMRRTGVCLLADAKVPLHEIAEYGRWKDTSTVENVYLRDQSQRAKRERHFSERMIGCVESSTILVPKATRSERSPSSSSSSSSAVDVDFAWEQEVVCCGQPMK